MSEKIEFIPANELPVAETADGDTLCVEDGELKRKPAYDIKVRIKTVYNEEYEVMVPDVAEIVKGDYADILKKIDDEIYVSALVIVEQGKSPWNFGEVKEICKAAVRKYTQTEDNMVFIQLAIRTIGMNDMYIGIDKNNELYVSLE